MHFRDGADEDEEYEYDENGDMTKDLNSGIENIEYNVLNLPKLITFANGGTIRYTYSATGEKLRAEYTMTSDSIIKTTDYCGNLIYEQGRPKMLLVDGVNLYGGSNFFMDLTQIEVYWMTEMSKGLNVVNGKPHIERMCYVLS